eukprot:1230769-Prorocentrum_lima.AAC.1
MTSSLVGSEMCIRDRMFEQAIKKEATSMIEKNEAMTPQTSTESEEAVSYTHLTLPTICSV